MRVVYRGTKYELPDVLQLTRPETSLMKQLTGLPIRELVRQAQQGDLDAICAWLLVAKRRIGDKVEWSHFDDATLGDFDWPDDDEPDVEPDEGESRLDPT